MSETGLSYKQFLDMKAINKFDLSLGHYCKRTACQFHEKFIRIDRIDRIWNEEEFRFLNKMQAPNGWGFIYCVHNKESNIIKVGTSTKPWQRITSHINNFICYAGTDIGMISVIFSRNPFPDPLLVEKQFTEYVNDKAKNSVKIKKEFFHFSKRPKDKLIMDFFIHHEENLFYEFKF